MPPPTQATSGTDPDASSALSRKQKRNRRTRERKKRRKASKKASRKASRKSAPCDSSPREAQEGVYHDEDPDPVVSPPSEGGPDLSQAMRITTEVIEKAQKYRSTLDEWTLDLRGANITAIENMGLAAKHNYDCIDLMDNDIHSLTGFPVLQSLDHLMIGNNRVAFIDPDIGKKMPRLMDFTAQNNRIAELGDLVPLGGLRRLEHLMLLGNPVTSKENYEYFLIWLCPKVRFIDAQHVKDKQRARAKELFGTKDAPTAAAQSLMAQKSNEFDIPVSLGEGESSQSSVAVKVNRMNLEPEEQRRLQQIIGNAKSMEEVEKLEKDLSEGRLPLGVLNQR